jgi:hypothetical protein
VIVTFSHDPLITFKAVEPFLNSAIYELFDRANRGDKAKGVVSRFSPYQARGKKHAGDPIWEVEEGLDAASLRRAIDERKGHIKQYFLYLVADATAKKNDWQVYWEKKSKQTDILIVMENFTAMFFSQARTNTKNASGEKSIQERMVAYQSALGFMAVLANIPRRPKLFERYTPRNPEIEIKNLYWLIEAKLFEFITAGDKTFYERLGVVSQEWNAKYADVLTVPKMATDQVSKGKRIRRDSVQSQLSF